METQDKRQGERQRETILLGAYVLSCDNTDIHVIGTHAHAFAHSHMQRESERREGVKKGKRERDRAREMMGGGRQRARGAHRGPPAR